MRRFFRFFIRVSAFVRKEIVEVLRQPRLVMTLIVGPFLILLLFGVGYQETARTLRTVFVVAPDSTIRPLVEEYSSRLKGQISVIGVEDDIVRANEKLQRREVDLVVMTPFDPYSDIRASKQSLFRLFHNEIDPFEQAYVNVLEREYINELNKQVLLALADEGKTEAAVMQHETQSALEKTRTMKQALEAGNGSVAAAQQAALNEDLGILAVTAGSGLVAYTALQQFTGGESAISSKELSEEISNLQKALSQTPIDETKSDFTAELENVNKLESRLTELDENLTTFQGIDSLVLVQPFQGETVALSAREVEPMHFFVPAVIALLLQHISVTIAALSIVREQAKGAVELFRASPTSAFETLLGKYISYTMLSLALASILTLLVVAVLRVPMLGDWYEYSTVILALIFTSLGLGFVISLISKTDSQAVQYSMIVLLASIFFSGFFIALYRLTEPVRIVSWSLPATYGVTLLQDVMLRGQRLNVNLTLALFGIGMILFLIALLRMRRLMARG